MRLPGIVALCFSLQSAWGQDQSVRLWAVSENVRVNPVTGTLMEARPDIHQDYPSEDYRLGNLRLLKHGYPPDKQEKAPRTVFEQAEALSAGWGWAV